MILKRVTLCRMLFSLRNFFQAESFHYSIGKMYWKKILGWQTITRYSALACAYVARFLHRGLMNDHPDVRKSMVRGEKKNSIAYMGHTINHDRLTLSTHRRRFIDSSNFHAADEVVADKSRGENPDEIFDKVFQLNPPTCTHLYLQSNRVTR